jgi:hypothetical protein
VQILLAQQGYGLDLGKETNDACAHFLCISTQCGNDCKLVHCTLMEEMRGRNSADVPVQPGTDLHARMSYARFRFAFIPQKKIKRNTNEEMC